MDIWYNCAKAIVRSYLLFFTEGFDIYGKDNVPSGPKILIANHTYVTDAFILPFIFPEKLHFLIQEEVFTLPFIGRILDWADQIPVAIGQGRHALKVARDKLAMGNSVVIFPEGQLNNAEGLRRAGSGAAILSLQSGAPLVPMGIYVPSEFVKGMKGRLFDRTTYGAWQMRGKLFVNIGDPWVPASEIADRSYHSVREVTNRMMEQVQTLVLQAQTWAQQNF